MQNFDWKKFVRILFYIFIGYLILAFIGIFLDYIADRQLDNILFGSDAGMQWGFLDFFSLGYKSLLAVSEIAPALILILLLVMFYRRP